MKKEQLEIIHKAIKILEAIILIILGVIVCGFANNEDLQGSIGYCLAFILLTFGLFNVAFAYLFKKGVSSLDTIFGVFLISLGFLLIIESNVLNEYIPIFFGIMLITYGTIFLIETLVLSFRLKKNPNLAIKFAFFMVITIILLGGGIVIVLFRESLDTLILILVGIILVLVGVLSLVHLFTKLKKKEAQALVKADEEPTKTKKKSKKKEEEKEEPSPIEAKEPKAIETIEINLEETNKEETSKEPEVIDVE